MYRFRAIVMGSALALLAAAPLPASAQNASVRVLHLINGTDLGLTQRLPVDVAVDGSCLLQSFIFGGDAAGPLSLPAPASYNVTVHLSDGNGQNCTGATVIDTNVDLLFGQNVYIAAHLSASGTPKATAFEADLNDTSGARARVSVQHGASAPTVDVILRREDGSDRRRLRVLSNMEQGVTDLRPGTWLATVRDAASGRRIAGPLELELARNRAYFVFAQGSAANGTFGVRIESLRVR